MTAQTMRAPAAPLLQQPIFHMCRQDEWAQAPAAGSYPGSSQDAADGFIHFSTAGQLPESARRHRKGQPGLALLTVDPALLGDALRWEPSRDGALFPHLYGPLPTAAVLRVDPLPLDDDGVPIIPSHVITPVITPPHAGAQTARNDGSPDDGSPDNEAKA